MGRRRLAVVLALLVLLTASVGGPNLAQAGVIGAPDTVTAPTSLPSPLTGLFLDPSPGDVLTLGVPSILVGPDHRIAVTVARTGELQLVVDEGAWRLWFRAGGGEAFEVGRTYEAFLGLTGTGWMQIGHGEKTCSAIGAFTIAGLDVNAAGAVTSLAIDFVHHCQDWPRETLVGSLRIASTIDVVAVTAGPSTLDLGSIPMGESGSPAQVSITNAGTTPVGIGPFDLSGRDADEVAMDATGCGTSLAPDTSCQILLTGTALRQGPISATVTIHDATPLGTRTIGISGLAAVPTTTTMTFAPATGLVSGTEFSATVSPNPQRGTVAFEVTSDGTITRFDASIDHLSGSARVSVYPPLGDFTVTATFGGNSPYLPSTSNPAAGRASATPFAHIGLRPSREVTVGTRVSLEASVWAYGYDVTGGTFEVRDGAGTLLVSSPVPLPPGGIVLDLGVKPVGEYAYTAQYSGTSLFEPVSSTTWLTVRPADLADYASIEEGPRTRTSDVTLRLRPSVTGDDRMRVSNDGISWVELPWAPSIPWSLTDPAGGGTADDGGRWVRVDYGDSSGWHVRSGVNITLDRVAPTITDPSFRVDGRTWVTAATQRESPTDIAGGRYSLDGVTWGPWQGATEVDLFAFAGTGGWALGDRMIWMQVRDTAGNESQIASGLATITPPAFTGLGDGVVPVTFEAPLLPITGQPFTIRPVYPAGYMLPADAWCFWRLEWGDDESIMSYPNPAWGELLFERPKSSGACGGWTFTLPWTPGRQYHWTFELFRRAPGVGVDGPKTSTLFNSSNAADQVFRAALDSTDPRILTSSPPIAYLLPETTVSRAGDPVTYRLHVAGTTVVPQTGLFWTHPIACNPKPNWSQQGGYTFTYRPNCDGAWVTGWTGTMLGGYMRSQYDPLVDGRAPSVKAPVAWLRTGSFGTLVPVMVRWSAVDSGSGVFRYELQASRNGGAWATLTLASRLSTSATRYLATTGTYRFRVRARDRVGNWSAWMTGPTVRGGVLQEGSSAISWTKSWTLVAGTAYSGGAARKSTAPASARLALTARSIGWVGQRGPTHGQVEVWVDGALATTLDLYAPAVEAPSVLFTKTWTNTGWHVVTIRNLATPGRPKAVSDAFLVVR